MNVLQVASHYAFKSMKTVLYNSLLHIRPVYMTVAFYKAKKWLQLGALFMFFAKQEILSNDFAFCFHSTKRRGGCASGAVGWRLGWGGF